jgi:hypothetical protein
MKAFLPSVLDGDEWSALRPGRFTSRKRAHGTHWLGGWVGSRARLDTERGCIPRKGCKKYKNMKSSLCLTKYHAMKTY